MSDPLSAFPDPLPAFPDPHPPRPPVDVLREELHALRVRIKVCEARLEEIEPEVAKIPVIERRQLKTEKLAIELQLENRQAARDLATKMDELLRALQPNAVL